MNNSTKEMHDEKNTVRLPALDGPVQAIITGVLKNRAKFITFGLSFVAKFLWLHNAHISTSTFTVAHFPRRIAHLQDGLNDVKAGTLALRVHLGHPVLVLQAREDVQHLRRARRVVGHLRVEGDKEDEEMENEPSWPQGNF